MSSTCGFMDVKQILKTCRGKARHLTMGKERERRQVYFMNPDISRVCLFIYFYLSLKVALIFKIKKIVVS